MLLIVHFVLFKIPGNGSLPHIDIGPGIESFNRAVKNAGTALRKLNEKKISYTTHLPRGARRDDLNYAFGTIAGLMEYVLRSQKGENEIIYLRRYAIAKIKRLTEIGQVTSLIYENVLPGFNNLWRRLYLCKQ